MTTSETRYSPVAVVHLDGKVRCGIVTCQTCGAAVLIDQRSPGESSTAKHARWHEAGEDDRTSAQQTIDDVETNRSDLAALTTAVTLGVEEAEAAARAALTENTATIAENTVTIAENTARRRVDKDG